MSVTDISRGACIDLARRLRRMLAALEGAPEPVLEAGRELLDELERPGVDRRRIVDLSAAFVAELEADLRSQLGSPNGPPQLRSARGGRS